MKFNPVKRREVMERSIKLGHCICDPRRPCPCDVFREQSLCPCAGERPDPVDLSEVKLTRLVRNAGCASKISPADLEGVLRRLPEVKDPAVISGLAAADDAAIYRLTENVCLVQTVDVFTPCVDDPHLFGRICAANCLSDIYAMGGDPRTALSVLAFPSETLDGQIMFQMLSGAMETLAEAGVALVGGHSIKDEEIKLGFAITGTIDPAIAAALEQPRTGDVLVLTKPLGTGVLSFASQIGRETPATEAAAKSMATLNKGAAEAMKMAQASACTDITGFGLFAHLLRLARQSKITARVFADQLPAFEGVLELFREGVIPGAIERNREFLGPDLEIEPGVEEAPVCLGCDAQTSGGLLIAVPPNRLENLRQELTRRGVPAFVIGEVAGDSTGRVVLQARARRNGAPPGGRAEESKPVTQPKATMDKNVSQPVHDANCCAESFEKNGPSGKATEAQKGFANFMRAVQADGALSEKSKELILFALVLQSRCAGCFDAHYERAVELGLTRAELDETAWCAISMGGAPVRMFYQESLRRIGAG